MAVAGILLAAGESSRMNRPKALLPWGGTPTLLEHQVRQMREGGCDSIIVVWGSDPRVAELCRKLGVSPVLNESWPEGRASSTRTGAKATPPDAEVVAVVSVDQPTRAEVIKTLLEQMNQNPAVIYVPTYKGKRGHPVVLPGRYLPELREVREETLGLHHLIEAYPPAEVELDEPLIGADINTREDYLAWHQKAFGELPPD